MEFRAGHCGPNEPKHRQLEDIRRGLCAEACGFAAMLVMLICPYDRLRRGYDRLRVYADGFSQILN